ncbi:MAG: GIY-YIG nuclease family protein [Candidatus Omnitrophica bacterium]|nr:GIY-YIG nuclease family protein [Candidatus Omnitrophota bacterium]
MYFVYVIQSGKTGRYYTGSTENLERRLKEHNSDKVRSTKNKGPWKLVYKESAESKCRAIKREHYIKKLKGGNGFKRLISVPIV